MNVNANAIPIKCIQIKGHSCLCRSKKLEKNRERERERENSRGNDWLSELELLYMAKQTNDDVTCDP